MRWAIVLILIIPFVISLSQSPKALEYYSAGMSAYLSGDYDSALKWFEKALTLSPDIESYDPKIKLKMGICAFMTGDYETAKDFLKLYPDDVTAKNILKIIEKGIPQEDWEKWLMIPEEVETPSTPATAQTETKEGKSPFLIYLGVFVVVFSALMILELKFSLVTSLVAKIPRIKIVIGKEVEVVEVRKPETVVEVEEKTEEVPEEGEISVSFEEIINAPLEMVDKLIYGSETFEGLEEEMKEEKEEKIEEVHEPSPEVETEEKAETEEETVETPEEKPSTTELIKEIVGEEEREEEEEDFIEKAEKLLGQIKPEREELDLEEAMADVDELLDKLEEKEEYTQEDADLIVRLLNRIVHEETGESVSSQ